MCELRIDSLNLDKTKTKKGKKFFYSVDYDMLMHALTYSMLSHNWLQATTNLFYCSLMKYLPSYIKQYYALILFFKLQ